MTSATSRNASPPRSGPLASLIGLALLLLGAVAFAQPARARTWQDEFARAMELVGEGKLREATDTLELASRQLDVGGLLFHAAAVAERGKDLRRAADLYEAYLKQAPYEAEAAGLREHIGGLRSALAAQGASQVASGPAPYPWRSALHVEGDAAGAGVRVYRRGDPAATPPGGEPAPAWVQVMTTAVTAPAVLALAPGHYRVEVQEAQGARSISTEVDVNPQRVCELRASLSRGGFLSFLRVAAQIQGARIYVDQPAAANALLWGTTPTADFVQEGAHNVRIEAPGFEPFTVQVNVDRGQTKDVWAELQPLRYSNLRFDSLVGRFSVDVDGRPAGTYDWRNGAFKLQVWAGSHRVRLSSEDRRPYEGVLDVPAGRTLDVHVNFEEKKSYQPSIVLMVLGAGCGVGSAILADHTGKLDSTADRGTKSTLESLTVVAGIGAGVFAAVGLVMLIDFGHDSTVLVEQPKPFDAPAQPRPGLRGALSPFVAQNSGGLSFTGTF